MVSIDIKPFKTGLLERKEQIENNINNAINEMSTIRNQSPKDEGDYASFAIGADIDHAIMKQQQEELKEINIALGKIGNKTYGICELCEDEINIERLKVKNYARYCIACREITEKEDY